MKVSMSLILNAGSGEGGEPFDLVPPENGLNAFPTGFPDPFSLLFLQRFNARFVVPNRRDLGTEHD